MDLYAPDEAVAALEAEAGRTSSAPALAELAWHLRQRDTARSLALAERIEAAHDPSASALAPRLLLARCEGLLLLFRIEEASAELARLPELLAADCAEDRRVLEGDAALLEAAIATARGRPQDEVACARHAHAAFAAAGERRRADIAAAAELATTAKADAAPALEAIARLRAGSDDPVLALHLDYVSAIIEFTAGRFTRAIELLSPGARNAARLGAAEAGLRALLTIAAALSNLGDREGSAKAGEEALARARSLGWPRWIAGSLAHLGRLFTYMEQPARAIEVLEESAAILSAQPGSRQHAMALFYLGDAYLHAGDAARALQSVERSEAIARDLAIPPDIAANAGVAAKALARLGRHDEALARGRSALELARSCGAKLWEAEALRSLAEIRLEREPREALGHLEEAIEVSAAIGGHHEKSQVWVEIARVHERSGDLAAALAAERRARIEQLAEQHRRAANQVLVSRMRHEMEALAKREAEMRRLATIDPLTGLANRRHFFAAAEREVVRAQRSGACVALVMGDIDKFKSINDAHGHPGGDAVLVAVAGTLATESRPHDTVGRLGGEEFAVLLPGADASAVLAAAERLRASVESLAVTFDGCPIAATISLGCAVLARAPAGSAAKIFEALVQEADAALYEAKRAGRNRCVLSGAPAETRS